MTLFQRNSWSYLACFFVSLLFTVLLSVVPSIWQFGTATSNGNSFEVTSLGEFDTNSTQTNTLTSSFEEVAASHLEPNFY